MARPPDPDARAREQLEIAASDTVSDEVQICSMSVSRARCCVLGTTFVLLCTGLAFASHKLVVPQACEGRVIEFDDETDDACLSLDLETFALYSTDSVCGHRNKCDQLLAASHSPWPVVRNRMLSQSKSVYSREASSPPPSSPKLTGGIEYLYASKDCSGTPLSLSDVDAGLINLDRCNKVYSAFKDTTCCTLAIDMLLPIPSALLGTHVMRTTKQTPLAKTYEEFVSSLESVRYSPSIRSEDAFAFKYTRFDAEGCLPCPAGQYCING